MTEPQREASDYQSPSALQQEIRRIHTTAGEKAARYFGFAQKSDEQAAYFTQLLIALLDYSAFGLAPAQEKVNVFDDPFVGAAIVDAEGRVWGSHRKSAQGQRHAEPAAILNALATLDSEEAAALAREIETAYAEMSWLRSIEAQRMFVSLFARAGVMLRKSAGSSPIVVLSTLEPCRDFESQPSCAELLVAFKPDAVVYAADDTNAKGQGRALLEKHHLPVLYNLAVGENIRVNKLFYAAIDVIGKLHSASVNADERAVRYAAVSLDLLTPTEDYGQDRLSISFLAHTAPIHIYEARPEADAMIHEAPVGKIDASRVLFIDAFNIPFIFSYLRNHQQSTMVLPGVIVSCDDYHPEAEEALATLRRAGIVIHRNVLRQPNERLLALRNIRQWVGEDAAGMKLQVLVRSETGYARLVEEGDKIRDALHGFTTKVRRVSIYMHHMADATLRKLVRQLQAQDLESKIFSDASFAIHITNHENEDIERDAQTVRDWLRSQGLTHRFVVYALPPLPRRASLQSSALQEALAHGRVDPILKEPNRWLNAGDWHDRQAAGSFLSMAARSDPFLYGPMVVAALNAVAPASSLVEDDWESTCSRLNAIAGYGEPPPGCEPKLFERLKQLGGRLAEASEVAARPQLLDLVWRLIAAAFRSIVDNDSLATVVGDPRLVRYYARFPFLLKEVAIYATQAASSNPNGLNVALSIIQQCAPLLTPEAARELGVRLTRVRCAWPASVPEGVLESYGRVIAGICATLGDARSFEEEGVRCNSIISGGLDATFTHNDPLCIPTYLFLRTLTNDAAHGAFAFLEEILKGTAFDAGSARRASWRGDKTRLAALVLTETAIGQYLPFLAAMAVDEDETVRWAALVLLCDWQVRRRMVQSMSKADWVENRRSVSAIIDRIVDPEGHYWLVREFLALLDREHSSENPLPREGRLQLQDLPRARRFVKSTPDEHPEVRLARERLRRHLKRVLLVLPPVADESDLHEDVARSSTPALGLGSVASSLLAHGHDVTLADCHRYPQQIRELSLLAEDCDVIGFSVVTSTIVATRGILHDLQTTLREAMPLVVIGGHAPTIAPSHFLEPTTPYPCDVIVAGEGETVILDIVADPTRYRRSQGQKAMLIDQRLSDQEWEASPWIDRKIFIDPSGEYYEPAPTRGGLHREAHVVMSRGCAWACNFCTEKTIGIRNSLRLSSKRVSNELKRLVTRDGVTRIQFVDDNLLPQIAVTRIDRVAGLEWSRAFLEALVDIRNTTPSFGWRGIFRFEDFIAYGDEFGDWFDLLKASGCRLLAFGVEHGDEGRRKRMKAGTVSNETIVGVVSALRNAAIATKGYFIIGGPDETEESSEVTTAFACNAGFTLSYFALFKNFVGFANNAKRSGQNSRQRESLLATFGSLDPNLEAVIRKAVDPQECLNAFGVAYSPAQITQAIATMDRLSEIGFSFRDLFKYNDYHEESEDTFNVAKYWFSSDDSVRRLHRSVRRAYFEFYARESFVEDYKALVLEGY